MKKYWPFAGIALAVALGVALAPYLGWIALIVAGACALWFGWRWIGVLVLLTWPVWLWRIGSKPDAIFVLAVYGAMVAWPAVQHRFTAADPDPKERPDAPGID